ncbi:MAG: hypothetical protein HXX09_01245 [Bacteroidetes bacterium]|nr:hypothetical protein [Bacteroidota bacterium]
MIKESERIETIIKTIPKVKKILKWGGNWESIKFLCEPVGLINPSLKEQPSEDDFLLDQTYWELKLIEAR